MMSYCKYFLLAILLSSLNFWVAWGQDAITWPELPKGPQAEPLVLQLAISSTQLAYGRPFDFYVRFVNCGETDLEITLPIDFINEHETLKSAMEQEGLSYPSRIYGATAFLSPKASFIMKIPNQYVWLGKHAKMVSYIHPNHRKEVKSNIINYVCEKKPFSETEAENCRQELEKAIDALSKEKSFSFFQLQFTGSGEKISNLGVKGIPCSLPVIKKHLAEDPNPGVRYMMAEILSTLGRKRDAGEIGLWVDFSSADLLIEQLAKEKDAWVLGSLLSAISLYSAAAALTPEQRKQLLELIMPHVDATNPMVRSAALWAFPCCFPDHDEIIEERLNRKDFYDQTTVHSARKWLLETRNERSSQIISGTAPVKKQEKAP